MQTSHALSLPNILTYSRILAVPLVVGCFYVPGETFRLIALGLFIVAAVTDFFDGYLARAWHQQSAIGRMLDPIADKLLVAACLMMMAADGTIRDWSMLAALTILTREILVSGLREFLAELRVSVPVSNLAKWKTTLQLIAIGVLLGAPAVEPLLPGVTDTGIALLWVAAILTLYTGYDYCRAGIRHLLEETEP